MKGLSAQDLASVAGDDASRRQPADKRQSSAGRDGSPGSAASRQCRVDAIRGAPATMAA